MHDLSGHDIERYHVIKKLGEGRMATVYRALDTRLGRDVAVKVIRREKFGEAHLQKLLQRFEREALALAKLTHPNIVGVIDYGEYQGSPYLVMPYLPGGTLKQRMGKPMPYGEACRLLAPLADALGYAHERGIVHRDVKPSNILLTEGGKPMLTDFGIARLLEGDGQIRSLTGTGVGIGTPEYMSPEQGQGLKVDVRTDVYALGAVLYELVTGRVPYQADTPFALVYKHINDPLPRPRQYAPDLPEEVEKVLFRALAKNPQDRYAEMGAMKAALEELERMAAMRTPAGGQARVQPTPQAPQKTQEQTALETDATAARQGKGRSGKGIWLWLGGLGLLAFMCAALLIGLAVQGSQTGEGALGFLATRTPTRSYAPTPPLPPSGDHAIGDTWISPMDGMTLVYVPAGEFLMGAAQSDSGAYDGERPQHTVYLDGFWIDRTEVTNAMYARCVAAGACGNTACYMEEIGKQDHPVVCVTWYDAQDYCEWAGRRLPTEAEWEKAARGTDGRLYPWGNQNPAGDLLNYCDKHCELVWKDSGVDDGYTSSAPVGSYPVGASPYGALDMAGNVWEWVNDWYDEDYYGNSPTSNPSGPASGSYRVLRGGSWGDESLCVRASYRNRNEPVVRIIDYGFRCAR